MTNAIEQAKREMYLKFGELYADVMPRKKSWELCKTFESSMEAYFELLRQDHEALHHTARARFEDTRKLEAANQDLIDKLSLMTTDRDSLRNRMQAKEALEASVSTSGQTSGDRASCATPDAKTMALLGAVVDLERIVGDYAMTGLRAKKAMKLVAGIVNGVQVHSAMKDFESPGMYYEIICNTQYDDGVKTTRSLHKGCMHSFFAIGDDQMKCTFCGVGK